MFFPTFKIAKSAKITESIKETNKVHQEEITKGAKN